MGIWRKGLVLAPVTDDGDGGDSRSLRSWKKSLKALSRIQGHKLPCFFFLHAHSIKGLPNMFDESSLHVAFVRKNEVTRTRSSGVSGGIVCFHDTLMHTCTVFCHKMNGACDSSEHEMKLFVIHAHVSESPRIYLGELLVDLARLLPVCFHDLDGEKSSGGWTKRFKLMREAIGAVLNVSFGFSLGARSILESRGDFTVSELVTMSYGWSSAKKYNAGSRTEGNKPFFRRA